jgi:hypothetical protein
MFICKGKRKAMKKTSKIISFPSLNRTALPLGILAVFSFLFIACSKDIDYPIEPVIEFKDFKKIANDFQVDDKGILTIGFTDGDGDIGLETWDTLPPYNFASPYYYNIYIDYYEKKNGVFELVELPLTNNARIPYVSADLLEKGIRGDIEIELYINNVLSPYDTVKFSVFIYDRALHQSNTIETPEIVIDKTF